MARNNCMLKLSADLAVNTIVAPVPFNVEVYDNGGWHSSGGVFIVPSGVDMVNFGFNIGATDVAANTVMLGQVLLNGATSYPERAAQSAAVPSGGLPTGQGPRVSGTSGDVPVSPGDAISLSIFTAPADTSFTLQATRCNFWIRAVPA